jgi:hypothetical protein
MQDGQSERTPDRSEAGASPGRRTDSEEPTPFSEVPGPDPSPSEPAEAEGDDEGAGDEERIDPFEAFTEISSKVRKEKAERDPAISLPGEDDLDQEGTYVDEETKFSGDGWRGRGNPQVGVRLRPRDFERLGEAASLFGVRRTTFARMMIIRGVKAVLDAERRRDGEFLRERRG